jgi:hypothetical protein
MRPQCGDGRVLACARRHLGGQVIDTVIRHGSRVDLPPSAMGSHRVSMIQLPLQARLMPCIGSPTCQPIAPSATSRAVDLAVIVELAETDDLRAPCATNPRTNPVFLHARTSTAALEEVAPPVRLPAPSPGLRPRATRRLRALHLGLHLFRGHSIAYETSRNIATSRPTPRCHVFPEIRRSLTLGCSSPTGPTWWPLRCYAHAASSHRPERVATAPLRRKAPYGNVLDGLHLGHGMGLPSHSWS